MEFLFLVLVLMAAAGGWWYLSDTREAALAAAQRHCDRMGVQFLDGSVSASGIRFTRNRAGTLVLVQKFRFEFSSTGDERYEGRAEMVGRRVVLMELEPHRV